VFSRWILGRVLTSRIVLVAYAIVGFLVANSHHYFAHLGRLRPLLSAVLAVLLWPLLLFGVNVRIK
jgi:hypothetical protein